MDKLQVDLIAGNADEATAKVQKFGAEIVKTDEQLKKLGSQIPLAGIDKAIAQTEIQASNLRVQLRQIQSITIGNAGLNGLGLAAQRAEKQVTGIYSRLRQIETETGKTSNPTLLKSLEAETVALNSQLDKLQTKIDRVGQGRAAAAQKAAATTGKINGIANAASAFLPPEVSQAIFAAQAASEAGLLAAAGPFVALAAAGAVVVKISERIRDLEKERLKLIEATQIAINKQILERKQSIADFQNELRDRETARANANADLEQLRAQRDIAKRFLNSNPADKDFQQRFLSADDAVKAKEAESTRKNIDLLNEHNETFKKNQQAQREFEKRQLESINAGRARVAEFGKDIDALFQNLFAKKGENNPFVSVFTEAERAIESTRIATAALSSDLQKSAADLVAAQNANNLFSARLETRLSAANLRADAVGFRGGRAETDKDFSDRLDRELAARGFNPKQFGGFSDQQKSNFLAFRQSQDFADKASLDFARTQSSGFNLANARLNGVSIESLILGNIANERRQGENLTASDRLERQLAIIRDLNPANDVQRAEADRKIIALTQGLEGQLTGRQTDAAAGAREREAARLENSEAAAKAERTEAAAVQKSIDKNVDALLKLARSEGLQGVIRIINNAEDAATVELGKRPTPRDVTNLNEP